MECVLLIGIPGSGKSTFAASRFGATHVRLNLDMLRTRHRLAELFSTCLRLGQPCVLDNTNLQREERGRYLVPAKAAGFRTVGFYLASRLEECLPRNAARTGAARIPDVAVLGAAGRLELPDRTEAFDELHYVRLVGGDFAVQDWRNEVR